ncbi:hypothetical protein GCM10017783_02610 [Deinococcus piscis]|uniref:Uncharacterized protein n=1 Tax=Deinococcus piscis TaxID=394230 RepID=A0ABQ3JX72_9DEIO|nr:hypothetical protein [Deinococcus piscis]GHF94076.1 hypothetical protein GCM10017783_02610 [Deinococcus piscis]
MKTFLPGVPALTLVAGLWLGSVPTLAAELPKPGSAAAGSAVAGAASLPGTARLSAPALLEHARQAAGLPTAGLTLLHERVQTSEEGRGPAYLSDIWTDLAGQRLKITDYTGDVLDSVHLLTPVGNCLYTPQHGTVPVPPQRAEVLRWNLRSGVAGLGAASQPGTRLSAAGVQTWLADGPQPLRGNVLEVSWPDGATWQYLLDPQTGQLLADRSANEDLDMLTFTYSHPRAATGVKVPGAAAPQALEERTLWLGSEVLYREQVLTRELNPVSVPHTFELPSSQEKRP